MELVELCRCHRCTQMPENALSGPDTIAPVALGAGGKGVDMFSITVEPDNWICSEAARDTEYGRKLQAGKQAHQRPWICGCVLRLVEVGAYQPQSAQRQSMPLILK